VAKTAVNAFGGTPRVTRFWHDDHVSSVDMLSCEDGPQKGVTAYSTIGLSDWPLFHGDEKYPGDRSPRRTVEMRSKRSSKSTRSTSSI
jgi:hypothetical protein